MDSTEKDIPTYTNLIDIVQRIISTSWNIGNRIHQQSIDRWLDNFTGEALYTGNNEEEKIEAAKREKQIALFLLCNFVYYNENEIKHLVRIMLNKYVHNVFVSENKNEITDDDLATLIKKTQFTFLGNVSESSSYLLYLFRQENELSKQCFVETDTTENIVFIDDFSLTGSQAHDYIIDKMKDKNLVKNKRIYILLMITTEESINTLKQIPNIAIIPCIILDDKSKAFSDSSIVFTGYKSSCKEEAKKICEYYGEKITAKSKNISALGFGDNGYLFGAYYNIPDNTLPIFWSSQNNWQYFFKRYDKIYGVSGTSLGGRYV